MNVQLCKNDTKSFVKIAREKVSYYGEQQATLADALALIIGRSANSESCHQLSSLSVREILNLTQEEITEMGFSKAMAERLFASILFAKKLNAMSLPEMTTIRSPEDAAQALMYLRNYDQEVMVVLALDTKNQIIGKKEVFKGTLNASVCHPREIYRFALQKGAAGIIVAHNHLSGIATESREDCEVSRRLKRSRENGRY